MSEVLAAATVHTPAGLLEPGWVRVDGDRVVEVGAGQPAGPSTALGDVVLAPGFVDMHNHGGGGRAFTEGAEAAETVLATHLSHGTTSVVASLVTDTIDVLERQVRDLRPLVEDGRLVGTHLEGPWLSEMHCGAHDPALLSDPDPHDVARLVEAGGGTIAMVTLAVERDGGLDAVRRLHDAGVLVALGHSHATYAEALAAINAGASVATHLYNAARPVQHREPGLTLALLESPGVTVELIADGVHVHPAMIRDVARRAPGRVALITDAMGAAGGGDGDYDLGPLRVRVVDGVARLARPDGSTGAIAGSTLTLDRAVRFAVQQAGLGVHEAICAATQTPADRLGRADLGRIGPGARADLVVLDGGLQVQRVMRAGQWAVG